MKYTKEENSHGQMRWREEHQDGFTTEIFAVKQNSGKWRIAAVTRNRRGEVYREQILGEVGSRSRAEEVAENWGSMHPYGIESDEADEKYGPQNRFENFEEATEQFFGGR